MTGIATELPTLETGDRLGADEFHRRYELRPDIRLAELIDGVVYVAAAALRGPQHGQPHLILSGWVDRYVEVHSDVDGADNTTWRRRDLGIEAQPDLALWSLERGAAWIDGEGYIAGTPELLIEISASSASYDLHVKKPAYERAGVPEFIVWRTEDAALDWFTLDAGQYVKQEPDDAGRLYSRVFPGLRLNVGNLLAGQRGSKLSE